MKQVICTMHDGTVLAGQKSMAKKESSNPSKDHSLSLSYQQKDGAAQQQDIITHTVSSVTSPPHTAPAGYPVWAFSHMPVGEGRQKP